MAQAHIGGHIASQIARDSEQHRAGKDVAQSLALYRVFLTEHHNLQIISLPRGMRPGTHHENIRS